jgi:hypothetical protein
VAVTGLGVWPSIDIEAAARKYCAAILDRVQNDELKSLSESLAIIAFSLGAAWASGDKELMELAQRTLEGKKSD